jgi:hypothetical protein
MKYWLFQNNQVTGPFDREELSNTPGFSAESLVCPEGRKGTQMGDWQRAGVMAELAETLLKMARVPAGAGAGGGSSFLPPEPTLRDLAVLGTLQEKVSLLENSLSSLHEELRAREEEIAGLKTELSQKSVEAADMHSKVGDLELKLNAAESLREEVTLTKEAQAGEAKVVEDLKGQLDAVRSELQSTVSRMEETQEKLRSDLSSRIDDVRSSAGRPAPSPAPAPRALPAGAPAPSLPPLGAPAGDVSLAIPDSEPVGAPPAAGPAGLEPPALGGLEPPPLDLGGAAPAPVPLDAPPFDLEAPPMGDAPSLPATMAGGGFDVPPPDNPFGSHPTPLPMAPGVPPLFGPDTGTSAAPTPSGEGAVDLMAPEAKPKRRKGPLVALAVLVLGGGGLGAAWQMGMLDAHLKQFGLAKGGAKPAAPVAAPEPEPAAEPAADPQAGVPDRTAEALELAKGYPIPRLGKTLGATLEASAPSDGLVSPWNVKPGSEGRFEVSFYGKPGRLDFSYEVRLDAKEVRGLNAKSQAVLDGKAPPAAKPAAEAAPRKRGRYADGESAPAARAPRRPKANAAAAASALSEDPLGSLLLESSVSEEPAPEKAPARRRRRAAKPVPQEDPAPALSLDPPADEEAPAEEAPAPKRKRAPKADKSDEELTLDELLLPGVPKR